MKSFAQLFASLVIVLVLTQCTAKERLRGNYPTPEMIAELKSGLTQSQVRDILGPPTIMAPFQKYTWYYVGEHTNQVAFFTPEVEKQQVLKITFNKEGELTEAWQVSGSKGRLLTPDSLTTPTHGHSTNLWTELFGGIRPGVAP